MEDHHYLPSNGFLDAFIDLLVQINTVPTHTPITVVWYQHLPCYDSTFDDQELKTFSFLPPDLVFKYGFLTTWISSFRPWAGSDESRALPVPGLEFFTPTGLGMSEGDGMSKPGRQMFSTDNPHMSSLGHL